MLQPRLVIDLGILDPRATVALSAAVRPVARRGPVGAAVLLGRRRLLLLLPEGHRDRLFLRPPSLSNTS